MALANKFITKIYQKTPYFLGNIFGIFGGLRKYIEEKHYSEFKSRLSQLLKSQWFSLEELKAMQFQKLRLLIHYAYNNVLYYQKKFDEIGLRPDDIEDFDDIKKIPILNKDDIKKSYNDFIARNVDKANVIQQSTSGTTGSPFTITMDKSTLIWEKVWIQRHRIWGGYDHSDWRGSLGGHKIVPVMQKMPPFWRYNLIGRQILFSTYHMTPENLCHYVEKMRKSKITIIDGYPSTIYIFAKYLESRDIHLPMKAVFTGAEPLYDYQRSVIEDRLCCKIFDHYGLTEKVVSAGECEQHDGRHVTMEGTLVEIIPVSHESNKDNYGEIIGTSLVNYAMPLIRYKTGDMSSFIDGECKCGRKLLRIKPVETKMEDIITTPDGKFISASNLTFPFKPLSSIDEAQIVQEDLYNIRVRIIKGESYKDQDTEKLLSGLRSIFGKSLTVNIEFTDKIERTRTGKFRFVVSKVPFDL